MTTAAKQAHVWERDPHDWYVEEPRATEALLKVERFVGRIIDPACGQGNIVKALLAAGYDAIGSDIVDRTSGAKWFQGELDALRDYDFDYLAAMECPNVVMNPPFFRAKGAEAFIRRATVEEALRVHGGRPRKTRTVIVVRKRTRAVERPQNLTPLPERRTRRPIRLRFALAA